jgi:hypothetical protein
MKLAKKILKVLIISLSILMLIGQIQLFFQIRRDEPLNFIELGYPFQYFYFSIDGNLLQGSNPKNFILDFGLITIATALLTFLLDKIKK